MSHFFNDVLKTNNKTAIILNENCIYNDESLDSTSQGTQGNMCQILGKILPEGAPGLLFVYE